MADAVQDLNQMIERIRAQAHASGFEAGYKAAMTAVSNFAARGGSGAFLTPSQKAAEMSSVAAEASSTSGVMQSVGMASGKSPAIGVSSDTKSTAKRAPRGQNRDLVHDALSDTGVPGTAKTIQSYLQARGHRLPYSSVQNALFQLEGMGVARLVGRGTWVLKTNTVSPEQSEETV